MTMGMYDIICGDQVKCFYQYFKCGNDMYISGGGLRYYGLGNKVPYRTSWYNYTKNFNIINVWDSYDFPDIDILTVIRDGKVKAVKPLVEATQYDWNGIQRCINSEGQWLRIKTQSDALNYAKAIKDYEKRKLDYIKKYMPNRKRVAKLSFGFCNLTEEEKPIRMAEIERLKCDAEKEQEDYLEFVDNLRDQLLSQYIKNVKPRKVDSKEMKNAIKNIKKHSKR